MFGVGDPDTQHPRLERSVLSDDRRALLELRRTTGKDGMGAIWRRGRCCPRQPMRKLHGTLRLRTDSDIGAASAARRHLENGQIQFRLKARAVWPWQRSACFQWRKLW